MSRANPPWGAPSIHGELLKLGMERSQATVAKYMEGAQKPPSQTWRTFLDSRLKQLASTDFFVVPTVSVRILFVFVVLAKHRRRVIHCNLTAHLTSERTAQQIAEAFPWDTAPCYPLQDRDCIYGDGFRQRVRGMAIREVLTALRSPGLSPQREHRIGSVRRKCLDLLLVLNQEPLRQTPPLYFAYYLWARPHLSLAKDAPLARAVPPPERGPVVEMAGVGGLHHRYERRPA
jgi:hypothetical protein